MGEQDIELEVEQDEQTGQSGQAGGNPEQNEQTGQGETKSEQSEQGEAKSEKSEAKPRSKKEARIIEAISCAIIIFAILLLPKLKDKYLGKEYKPKDSILLDAVTPHSDCEVLGYANIDSVKDITSILFQDKEPKYVIAVSWDSLGTNGSGTILVEELPKNGQRIVLFFTADYKKVKGYKYVDY